MSTLSLWNRIRSARRAASLLPALALAVTGQVRAAVETTPPALSADRLGGGDVADVFRLGQAERKPIALVFYGRNCVWSQELLTGTMADDGVRALLEGFVYREVDTSAELMFAAEHRVRITPVLLLLSPDGREIFRHEGVLARRNALDILRAVTGGPDSTAPDFDAGESDDALISWGRSLGRTGVRSPMRDDDLERLFRWSMLPGARTDLVDVLRESHSAFADQLVAMLEHERLAMRLGALEILELWAANDFGLDPWETDADVTAPALKVWTAWAANPQAMKASTERAESDADFLRARLIEVAYDTEGASRRAWNLLTHEPGFALLPMLDRMLNEAPRLEPEGRRRLEELRILKLLEDAEVAGAAAAARRLVHGSTDVKSQVLESLAGRDERVWPVLLPFFTADDPLLRETAFDVAFRSAQERLMSDVADFLAAEEDTNVQFVLLRRIASRQKDEDAPLLVPFLEHSNEDLVIAAIEGIGRLQESQELWRSHQVRLLQDDRWRVRVAALGALRDTETQGVSQAAVALLEDEDDFVRTTAVQAVSRLKLKEAREILPRIFETDPASRPAVISAYSRMEVAVPQQVIQQAMQADKSEILTMITSLNDADIYTAAFVEQCIRQEDADIACAAIAHISARGLNHAHNIELLTDVLAQADLPRRQAFAGAASFGGYHIERALQTDEERGGQRDDDEKKLRQALSGAHERLKQLFATEKDAELRLAWGIFLLGLRDDSSVPHLQENFDKIPDVALRKLADSVGFLNPVKHREFLLGALQSEGVRNRIASKLLESGNPLTIRLAIEEMLQSGDIWPNDFSVSRLDSGLTESEAEWLLPLLLPRLEPDTRMPTLLLALKIAANAQEIRELQPAILQNTHHTSPKIRATAVEAIGVELPDLPEEDILRLLADSSPEVLIALFEGFISAVNNFAIINGEYVQPEMDKRFVDAARELLNHPTDDVAWYAGGYLILCVADFNPDRMLRMGKSRWEWRGFMQPVQTELQKPKPAIPASYAALMSAFPEDDHTYHQLKKHFGAPVVTDVVAEADAPDIAEIIIEAEPGELPAMGPSAHREPVEMVYFIRPGCSDCDRVHRMLDRVRESFPELEVLELNINKNESMELNEALSARFRVPESQRLLAPALFAGGGFLVRDDINEDRIAQLILRSRGVEESVLDSLGEGTSEASDAIAQRYESIRPELIIAAGLLDGLNPCAFATIIFLLSYLQIAKKTGREILQIGGAYILGVFSAYFTLGLGLVELVTRLGFLQTAGKLLNFGMAAFALVVAVLSIRDGIRCLKGRMGDMTLQLPGFLKDRIHKVIRGSVRHRNFVMLAFAVGVVISVLELACTGQVYAPTILYMLQSGRTSATGYLLVYNLAFVLPLTVVFVMAYFGLTSAVLTGFLTRHAAWVKFATAVLFITLALVLFKTA